MISEATGSRTSALRVSRALPKATISYQTIGFGVGFIEALVIVAGGLFGQLTYDRAVGTGPIEYGTSVGLGLIASVLYVSIARSAKLYRLPTLIEPAAHFKRIAGVCGVVLLLLTALFFLLKIGSEFSRGALTGFATFMLLLCVVARFAAAKIIKTMLSQGGIAGKPAFLIGEYDELAALSPAHLLRHFGLREVGRLPLIHGASRERTAGIEAALDAARERNAREFVLVTKLDGLDTIEKLRGELRLSPLAVKLMPNKALRSVIGYQSGGCESWEHLIELQRAPMGIVEQIIKRVMDIVAAATALIILLPIFAIAACAIKLDSPGPIIFRQRRNGFDQRPFTIFKFRSMSVLENGDAITQAKRGDVRVTRVGRILRKTSVDELPQLLNVLRGDMSMVGPRPHAMAHDAEYKLTIGDYCMRQHVKPGITGWAQVNGHRGETSRPDAMQKRVDLDIWYVNHRSTWVDLRIMMRTCFEVLGHEAY